MGGGGELVKLLTLVKSVIIYEIFRCETFSAHHFLFYASMSRPFVNHKVVRKVEKMVTPLVISIKRTISPCIVIRIFRLKHFYRFADSSTTFPLSFGAALERGAKIIFALGAEIDAARHRWN